LQSFRHDFANAAIAASRVGSYPCAARAIVPAECPEADIPSAVLRSDYIRKKMRPTTHLGVDSEAREAGDGLKLPRKRDVPIFR
jgi:hypothetical protein